MLAIIGAIVRILLGFVIACLAAGFVQVLFAVTPAELVAAGEARWSAALNWALLSSAHIAVFASPFALISIIISEWWGIRSFAYHAIIAMGIAVAGFGLIMVTEGPTEATIVNSYAMAAYLTSGFVAGLVYWLLAGRQAMRSDGDDPGLLEGEFEPARPQQTTPLRPDPARPAAPAITTGTVPATGAALAMNRGASHPASQAGPASGGPSRGQSGTPPADRSAGPGAAPPAAPSVMGIPARPSSAQQTRPQQGSPVPRGGRPVQQRTAASPQPAAAAAPDRPGPKTS